MYILGLHMTLDDNELWKYLLNQDLYIPQEFGIGIVGVGALFFAYGSVESFSIKLLIALVGLSSSFILCMHIFGAKKEFEQVSKVLAETNEDFFKRFDEARKWRSEGIYRFIYYPVTKLMGVLYGFSFNRLGNNTP